MEKLNKPFLNEVEELALENAVLRKKIDINWAKLQAAEEMVNWLLLVSDSDLANPASAVMAIKEGARKLHTAWERAVNRAKNREEEEE